MQTFVKLFVFISLTAPRWAAQAEDTKIAASKITAVTVYADRARVTRTAVNVPLGGRLAFTTLPGWIDEGSVRVSLAPASAGELLDVQIEKTFLARPDDAALRQAEAAVIELTDQLAALDDERAALDAQAKQTDAIRAFSLDKLPKDAAVREVKVEEYGGVVKFIGHSLLEISKASRELEKKRRELQPELAARQKKFNDLRQRAQLEQRSVVVTTTAQQAGATATVTLTYLLPGATWEPVHEVRTAADGRSVAVASFAVVTQTTGEDWEGAALTFSTQRPNTTERIPELEALLVGGGRSLTKVVNAGADSFDLAVANFEGNNGRWNTYANSAKLEVQQGWAENVKQQRVRQVKVVEAFQKVQQRGTTAQFAALGAPAVRTDGRLVRVPIGTEQLAATPRIVAAPELSLNAVQTADLVNTGHQPLLPGKVLLYAAGAFVGTTETEFVAPGEGFAMFLGVADRLKLTRTLDPKRSSLTWTGKRKRMLASFVVSVENLADQPVTCQLADRIPVSETEEIRVIGVRLQPEVKPDVKGLLKWDVTLAAKEKKDFRVEYTLEYPPEMPQQRAAAQTLNNNDDATAAPAASLRYQIEKLEKTLKK